MNREEYARLARINYAIPPDTRHPEGQKFRIGQLVQIVAPRSWFAGRETGQFFTVDYSYRQKYGWMNNCSNERDKHTYSLTNVATGVSSAWYDEDELEAASD